MNDSDEGEGSHGQQRDLLERYEMLADKLSQLLTSAKSGQWARVIEAESSYLAELEQLRYEEADTNLAEALQFRRARLGREILENSAELQRYLMERRDVLGKLIEQAEQQRRDGHEKGGREHPDGQSTTESADSDS